MRRLIINADDFGFTRDVNAGIADAHRNGVLTSTTLMANGAAFDDAVRIAKDTPTLGVGCHLVLIQGRSLVTGKPLPRTPRELILALGAFQLDVYSELQAQIQKIVDAGIRPSHLDTHKHAHLLPNVFSAVVRLARDFNVSYIRLPLDRTLRATRIFEPFYRHIALRRGIRVPDHFLGYRLTGIFTEATFSAALTELPEGLTEFMCHPGRLGPDLSRAATRLKESRVRELEALVSPRVRRFINEQQIELTNFDKLARHS